MINESVFMGSGLIMRFMYCLYASNIGTRHYDTQTVIDAGQDILLRPGIFCGLFAMLNVFIHSLLITVYSDLRAAMISAVSFEVEMPCSSSSSSVLNSVWNALEIP